MASNQRGDFGRQNRGGGGRDGGSGDARVSNDGNFSWAAVASNNPNRGPRPPPTEVDSVYKRPQGLLDQAKVAHAMALSISADVSVYTLNGSTTKGIFYTLSNEGDVVIKLATGDRSGEQSDTMMLEKKDIVSFTLHGISLRNGVGKVCQPPERISNSHDHPGGTLDTDGDLANRGQLRNRADNRAKGRERELQEWMPDSDAPVELQNYHLQDMGEGWTAEAMFEQNRRLRTDQGLPTGTSFALDDYSTRINKHVPNFREKEQQAARLAQEIERGTQRSEHVDVEFEDDEMEFSAVGRMPRRNDTSRGSFQDDQQSWRTANSRHPFKNQRGGLKQPHRDVVITRNVDNPGPPSLPAMPPPSQAPPVVDRLSAQPVPATNKDQHASSGVPPPRIQSYNQPTQSPTPRLPAQNPDQGNKNRGPTNPSKPSVETRRSPDGTGRVSAQAVSGTGMESGRRGQGENVMSEFSPENVVTSGVWNNRAHVADMHPGQQKPPAQGSSYSGNQREQDRQAPRGKPYTNKPMAQSARGQEASFRRSPVGERPRQNSIGTDAVSSKPLPSNTGPSSSTVQHLAEQGTQTKSLPSASSLTNEPATRKPYKLNPDAEEFRPSSQATQTGNASQPNISPAPSDQSGHDAMGSTSMNMGYQPYAPSPYMPPSPGGTQGYRLEYQNQNPFAGYANNNRISPVNTQAMVLGPYGHHGMPGSGPVNVQVPSSVMMASSAQYPQTVYANSQNVMPNNYASNQQRMSMMNPSPPHHLNYIQGSSVPGANMADQTMQIPSQGGYYGYSNGMAFQMAANAAGMTPQQTMYAPMLYSATVPPGAPYGPVNGPASLLYLPTSNVPTGYGGPMSLSMQSFPMANQMGMMQQPYMGMNVMGNNMQQMARFSSSQQHPS